jgi:hypothetical protein
MRAAAVERGRVVEQAARPLDIDPAPAAEAAAENPAALPDTKEEQSPEPGRAVEEATSMPPTMARARQTRPLHLAALDLAAVGALGEGLPQDLLQTLAVARWHYEAATEEPVPARFFGPEDAKPDAAALAGLIPDFVAWAREHSPGLPFAVIAPTPLHVRGGADAALSTPAGAACFDPEPHLMARAHIDTAADFCRTMLAEAAGQTQSDEADAGDTRSGGQSTGKLQACRRLVELSALRVFHQLTGDQSCGGAGYKEPRFVLDRAYIFELASDAGGEPQDLDGTAAHGGQYIRVTGIRYAAETPSMYFGMRDLIAETGFDRIVGRVPESMNPASHYLVFEAQPFDPEIAAAQQAEATAE